jgi:hypothetical protein
MANSLVQNPIVVDTAGASVLITQPLRVRKIRWVPVSTTAVDNAVTVKHKDGNVFWAHVVTDIGTVGQLVEPQESDFQDQVLNGLLVDTLTTGTLYIYVADNPPFKTT